MIEIQLSEIPKAPLLGTATEMTNSPRPLQEHFLPVPSKEEEKIGDAARRVNTLRLNLSHQHKTRHLI